MDVERGMEWLTNHIATRMRRQGVVELEPADVLAMREALTTAAGSISEETESASAGPQGDPLRAAAAASDEDRATTLVAASLAAAAARGTSERHWFHYWMSETLRGWFAETSHDSAPLAAVRARFQAMVTLGINLRGRAEPEFLSAWHNAVAPPSVTPTWAFAGAVACATYAGPDLGRALRVAAWTGDVAWSASLTLATLAGAFYGPERLREMVGDWESDQPGAEREGA